jgi:hypothetical protein
MKIISPKIHSYIDYLFSAILILLHWILGYELKEAASWIPLILGIATLTYSILTRYRHEHFGLIPFKTHLILDLVVGAILIVAPWIADFGDRPPYVQSILGVVALLVVLMTKPLSYGRIDPNMSKP